MDLGVFRQTATRSARNLIWSKKIYGSATVNGVQYPVGAALQTDAWQRTDKEGAKVAQDCMKFLKDNPKQNVPKDTKEVHVRETLHTSPSEPKSHFTVVYFDKDGNPTTGHIVPTEPEDKNK